MKRWLVLFLLFTAAYSADAQSFRWNRVNEDYWTTLGTVSSAPSGATTVVAAATATEILAIPDFAEVAAISIRSGTATAYIAHATAIAGSISQASLSLALFPNYEDALYYQRNHATLGSPPPIYFTASDGTEAKFIQANSAGLLASFGTVLFPVRNNRYMVLMATPANTAYINTHGLTVRVRFGR